MLIKRLLSKKKGQGGIPTYDPTLPIRYEDIVEHLQKYDNASPRMNAVLFVSNLCKEYSLDQDTVVKCIQKARAVERART